MAPDLVRLIARRNVHGHEQKKESIQPPSRARLGACAQRSVGCTSRLYLRPYPKELILRNHV
jgi:hypothetical protein